MAERRMFAKTVIDSDLFLDMPLSTQALYFHLSMRADDDGFINNPRKIQRMTGCSNDDLKLLLSKSFLIPFESGIVVIKHWKIHNYIQKDRYKPTIYQEEKALIDTNENRAYTLTKDIPEVLDTGCIHNVSEVDTQVRLGKVSQELGKERQGEKEPPAPYEQIKDLYNNTCTSLSNVRSLSDTRKKHIRARWQQFNCEIATFKEIFDLVESSKFLTGNNDRKWKADLDWLIKNDTNMLKVLEGKYKDGGGSPGADKPDDTYDLAKHGIGITL